MSNTSKTYKRKAHLPQTDAHDPQERNHSHDHFTETHMQEQGSYQMKDLVIVEDPATKQRHIKDMSPEARSFEHEFRRNQLNEKRRDRLMFFIYYLNAVAAWCLIIVGALTDKAVPLIFGSVLQLATIIHIAYKYGN